MLHTVFSTHIQYSKEINTDRATANPPFERVGTFGLPSFHIYGQFAWDTNICPLMLIFYFRLRLLKLASFPCRASSYTVDISWDMYFPAN
jgi:hypothetical protein